MRNVLLFLDGATYAAIWTVGPLLFSSLLLDDFSHSNVGESSTSDHVGHVDVAATISRPVSSINALNLATNIFRPLMSTSSSKVGADNVVPPLHERQSEIWKSVPCRMSMVMMAFLAGKMLGKHVANRSSTSYSTSRFCPRKIRGLSSSRLLVIISSALASILMMNWGFGVSTCSGWIFVRFVSAFIDGGLITWGHSHLDTVFQHSKENASESDLQRIEEGRPFLSLHNDVSSQRDFSITSSPIFCLNTIWLAGVAVSVLLSGFMFYPLNHLSLAIGLHNKFVTYVIFLGVFSLTDRFLLRCYGRSIALKRFPSFVSTFDDKRVDQTSTLSNASPNTGLVHRRKQPNQFVPSHQRSVGGEDHSTSISHQRPRINSLSSVESEVFFDCMEEIELGLGEAEESAANSFQFNQTPVRSRQDIKDQIAIYSNRKVIYPDNSPAYVPAGEKVSGIPFGYIALYGNNLSKAQSKYQETQVWRRKAQIQAIHARPHTWYPKIKVSYPHFIHGFTPNGMPVVYEAPGKMNLKELFRNGCRVDDMIFHYCYLMEYLSNLESILTELHSDLNEACGNDWQEELAAYAHAKQTRLQSDSVSFGFVVVMDISGASPSLLSGDVMTYLSRAGEINSLHYPGSMRHAIAVQAPYWLGAAWSAIKGVMPASVTVDLLSGSKTMEGGLKQYIDEEQIPAVYGGTSKFKLGEHPFEVGLRKLVETQPRDNVEEDEMAQEINAVFSNDPWAKPTYEIPEERPCNRQSTLSQVDISHGSNMPSSYAIEWDDLGADYILVVASTLQFLAHMLIGAVELVLPILLIIPPKQGIGFEARGVAITLFASCATVLWLIRRTRLPSRISSISEEAPLRGFRIGLGSSAFLWLCVCFVLFITPPNESKLGALCLVFYFTLLFFSCTLGIASVNLLRKISMSVFEQRNESLPRWCWFMKYDKETQSVCLFARASGFVLAAPVMKWYLLIPLNGSCFILLACVSGFLYTVSFSLHSVSPPPPIATDRKRRKVSPFVSAMVGMWSFVKELVVVALADIRFMTGRHQHQSK
ncbi:hypothetical protein HJC23_000934 [Cyclotella cryptica]|uniref:CRAL-TRIO domain-containing protein n=1 Tax=Cyclotella cryptica TaxID=29204 RepID=A0ABD3PWF1_9STRA|eukprot:CCRYP_004043-RA/>CCRYP_004043-RA protein AED:0.00 eAED:0.00 QI:8/-1/1/1/-1/1/1/771/1040